MILYYYAISFFVTAHAFNKYGYSLQKYSTTITDIPYHLVIVYRNLYCSGSLLRSRVAVTAASCLNTWETSRIVVKVGANTITGLGQVIEVVDVKIHEYYGHAAELDNDIALLYLKEHVIFGSNVKKILIMDANTELKDGTTIDVSGWGNVEHSPKYANSLLWSEMMVISPAVCKERYPYLATESNFCARYFPERRLSDNGGPATYEGRLAGILSYGAYGDQTPFIALLTNVSNFHKWINLNTKRFMTSGCQSQNMDHEHFDIDFQFD